MSRRFSRNEDDNNSEDTTISLAESLFEILATPTVAGSVVGAVPAGLLLVLLITPVAQGLLTTAIVAGLCVVARNILADYNDDDNDNKDPTNDGLENSREEDSYKTLLIQADLFCLVAAILTAPLLTPPSWLTADDDQGLLASLRTVTAIALVLLLATAAYQHVQKEKRSSHGRMQQWDWDFFNQLKHNHNNSKQPPGRRRRDTETKLDDDDNDV
jgi:hypothetical protein